MSTFQAFKENGQILFDTNLICYGLVKSGYMSYINSWTRKILRSAQLDPNEGSNWTATTAQASTAFADSMHGFTVVNALSPIVFIVGSGCLQGTSISGNSMTFYYANAGTDTKFYCFDLMADNMAGTTFMKIYDTAQRITFNSLQPPLNVVTSIQAPVPGALDSLGHISRCYSGGYNIFRQAGAGSDVSKMDSVVDISLGAGVEYAAFLPWSRSCRFNDMGHPGNVFPFVQYSGAEGAYGRVGGMSFMFGAAGGTTQAYPSTSGYASAPSFENIPTIYPVALVITTANLPFPFN